MKKWQNPELRQQILNRAKGLCKFENATLLYLVFFGSALYGTDSETSDIDVRGIFTPDPERPATGTAARSLKLSTGNMFTRNNAQDLDIDLWSAEYWIMDLLKKGDTGAIDLLFSFTSKECVILQNREMNSVFENTPKLISSEASEAAARYALGQAKKYGIKGSRLGLFLNIRRELEKIPLQGRRLREILPDLNAKFSEEDFYEGLTEYVVIGGKTHMAGISLQEFATRLDAELHRYGKRATEALVDKGIDFKALSHALRATGQHMELMRTGLIQYPLKFRDKLIEIKEGAKSWPETEKMILDDIARMRAQDQNLHNLHWDQAFAEKMLFSLSRAKYHPSHDSAQIKETLINSLLKN